MTNFLREWAKHYPIRFIIALILSVFFVRSIIAVQTSDSPLEIIIAFVLSAIIWDRLRVFNSSFEGLIDRYYVQGNCYLLVLSKDRQEFTEEVNLEQYEVAEIRDYVKKT